MAILTGPDYRLPRFVLQSDRKLPPEKQTGWIVRAPATECQVAIQQMVTALVGGRAVDPKRFDDGVRAVLDGFDNLLCDGVEIPYQEEDNRRDLLGEKRTRCIAADLLRRLPLEWKVELMAYAVAPQMTSNDVGN